jgi:lipopolysaccharide transport system permease protein
MRSRESVILPAADTSDDTLAPTGSVQGHEHQGTALAGLLWTVVRTDFKARYHGTLGGFAWALLKPAAMFVVLLAVFSFLFPDPNYKLQLMIGLFLWDFFAEGTRAGLASLHAKAFLFTKIRVPLWVLVVASIANPLITLAVFSVVIVAFLALAGSLPSAQELALFLGYCTAMTLLVLAFSLASSVLFLRFRDLNQVWDVMVQAGFFLAPIVYPLGIVPERVHVYFYLWPPTPIIEFSRAVLVSHTVPSVAAHAYLAIEIGAALAIGVLVMRRHGRHVAEHV